MTELKVEQMTGELAPVTEFVEAVGLLFGAMHKELAVRLPNKIAARLSKCKTAADIKAVLTREINHVFQDLRDNHHKYLEHGAKKAA